MRRGLGAVVVVGALVIVACADDDDDGLGSAPDPVSTTAATSEPSTSATSAPATTSIVTTTLAATTTAVTTEPAPTTTAFTPGPGDDRWAPACADQPSLTASATADDPVLDRFGPLGPEPGLRISLPLGRPDVSAEGVSPSVAVDRVPGGLALLVKPSSYDPDDFDGAIVTVVDHDGTVRWRRCLDGIDAAGLLAGGSVMLVSVYGEAGSTSWVAFDPVTGADVESPPEVDGLSAYPYGDHHVLLRRFDEQPIAPGEQLTVFDRATGALDSVDYPPGNEGKLPGEVEFVFSGDVLVQGDGYRPPVAIYHDGGWTSDPQSLAELVEPQAVYDYDAAAWSGRDGGGTVLWTRPDWVDVFGEGFRSIATDGVTLLVACRDGVVEPDTGLCVDTFFAGVETATGEVLWERAGYQAAPVAGDGLAIVTTSDDTYEMIDVHTGEAVDATQVWPGGSFMQGCCGEDGFVWTTRLGGVVVAVDYTRVTVYHPRRFVESTASLGLVG